MKPPILILCGGRGRRLIPLTQTLPKPLVSIHGKPILEHILDFYIQKRFDHFILCTGYKSEAIEKYIHSKKFTAHIEISHVGEKAGILKRIYEASHRLNKKNKFKNFIVAYGDTFIDINIKKMMQQHIHTKAQMTITIANIQNPFGIVQYDRENRIICYQEKPTYYYFVGHMILRVSLLNSVPSRFLNMPDGEGIVGWFEHLIDQKELFAYNHKGLKLTFNTLEEHRMAEKEMMKFYTDS
ncbi:MAG: nucleotidyltransferase family protein [Deltaproteobacteria bacterium]|nr:nucleotidyltransferase family protein [Deltaproteobacteria bacterium]